MLDIIIKAIEGSDVWLMLNSKCKAVYEQQNRIPTDEEYQALRNVLICKTMLEDETVLKMVQDYTFSQLNQ